MDVADSQVGFTKTKDDVGERCQKLFQDFLEEYKDENNEHLYKNAALALLKHDKALLEVSYTRLQRHSSGLANTIVEEYYRVYPYLCRALRNFVKDHATDKYKEKELFVSFIDVPAKYKVRDLTTDRIGTLLCISGQVVRTHPVHPELVSGTFLCVDCQTLNPGIEQQFKYTQPTICKNPVCNNRTRFTLDIHKSKFVDFQKIRIQETQAELPRGAIPRSVDVVVRSEVVEQVQPGDRCDFSGTLIVVPDVSQLATPGMHMESGTRHRGMEGYETEGVKGLKALGVRELSYRTCFWACSAKPSNPKFGGRELTDDLTPENLKNLMSPTEWERIYAMSQDKNLYQNLINSLFPSIHGNDEIKRGVLLMLFGGVPKVTKEGTTLRGDINVCIVGDPSTAKTQFLKQVTDFSPRAVYTSGKASSAAGLTAAVVKDEESGEFVIEAGALMLADNGVCCIDEFDKMDLRDQVAIHEAMEQQTISIAKAGVKATLNARTSILAAANPIGGRYDRTKSLKQNIALSPPIMSRFDLFFILVDDCNEVTDYQIARCIVDLHSQNEDSLTRTQSMYSLQEIQMYIMFARQFKPMMNQEAQDYLVQQYKGLRERDCTGVAKSSWRITVRQLESMIRLSEAVARLHCSELIEVKHVKEAFRLLNKSIIRVEQPNINLDEEEEEQPLTNGQAETNGHHIPESQESTKAPGQQTSLTYEEYKSICNLLVLQLRKEEEKESSQGLRKSELINWYLTEFEDEIETEAELVHMKTLVERVLERLIKHDRVIIPLQGEGLKGSEEMESLDDPILVVHPNYIPENF